MAYWNGTGWSREPASPQLDVRRPSLSTRIKPAALIAGLALVLAATTVFAGKGGGTTGGKPSGGGSSAMSVDMVADANSDNAPNWGDTVHFGFTTSEPYPVVSVSCSQGGQVVYGDSRPYYSPNVWDDPGNFTLSSMAWTSGAADCSAQVKAARHGRVVTLMSTSFQAGA
jgi:hypothetical protein